MKILFIQPAARESKLWNICLPALGIGYLAAIAKGQGHTAEIIDQRLPGQRTEKFLTIFLKKFKPDIVGLSSISPHYQEYLQLTKIVRPHTKYLIIGGPDVSAINNQSLLQRYPLADIFIIGEAENTFARLLELISNNRWPTSLSGTIAKNYSAPANPQIIDDLDSLPLPLRPARLNSYYYHPLLKGRATSLISSRGCPYSCNFCDKTITGTSYRTRSAKNIISEIKEIKYNLKINALVFYDDNFTQNRERIMELCQRIISEKININWKCESRVDRVDSKLLSLMKSAGCQYISYGIESALQKSLNFLNKGFNSQQVKEAIILSQQAKIKTLGYFILGIPGESNNDIEKTINFAKKLNLDFAQFSHLENYPGSLLARSQILASDTINKKIINRAYRQFYANPKRLFNALRYSSLTNPKQLWREKEQIISRFSIFKRKNQQPL